MTEAIALSLAVGFFMASPLGPMGLLCLRRVFSGRVGSGALSALGIACAYAFWAFVAARGVALFSSWIEQQRGPLEILVGLIFLLYGLHAVINRPKTDYPGLEVRGVAEFLSTFSVVFLNPTTFAMFAALFSVLGVASGDSDSVASLGIALAVFLGASTFWGCVFFVAGHLKRRLPGTFFGKVLRLSAVAIMLFGGAILVRAMVGPA